MNFGHRELPKFEFEEKDEKRLPPCRSKAIRDGYMAFFKNRNFELCDNSYFF